MNKQLSTVTLILIDSKNPELALKTIEYTSALGLHFKECKLLTSKQMCSKNVEVICNIQITSQMEYSYFCLTELYKYISTEHALIIQNDGFIIEPELWKDEWLSEDYIGAPWRGKNDGDYIIGNGGFSLRSYRIMEIISKTVTKKSWKPCHEDRFICQRKRSFLEKHKLKFAEISVALEFSKEHPTDKHNKTFGFHRGGYKNLYHDYLARIV